ncbi:serine hydrolase domain-containing protein [Pseudoalteromonas galatheae]|uniref:serine hydrolase domain-containing protein n=1 Tax=Pseudoalteromonas galatheae TaxID=579562 RepID=UPI0030CAE2F2
MSKLLYCAIFCSSLLSQTSFATDSAQHQVQQVAQNLLPRVQLKGQKYQPVDLQTRLQETHLPGLSLAVIKDGKVVWAEGYGIADKKQNRKVTTETLFQAGSISKPVAALAVLKLAQDGKVDLDADVNQYLTSWKVPTNEFTKANPVTLRQLMTHTSGLTQHGFPGYVRGSKIPTDVEVLMGKGNTDLVTVDTLPGKAWRYSGGGYTVMELLVADVTKMPFEEYVQQAILTPLGMHNSTYAQPLPKTLWSKASAAFDDKGEQVDGDWHVYPEQAAAGLWTTPVDLAKYIMAVQQAYAGNTVGPITPELAKQMLEVHHDVWGLGPELEQREQGLVFTHGGKNKGFSNRFEAFVEKGEGMVLMSNGDSASTVFGELRIAISEHYGWDFIRSKKITAITLSEERAKQLEGLYAYDKDHQFKMKITRDGTRFNVLDMARDNLMAFVATEEDTLIELEGGADVTIETNDKGEITAVIWRSLYRFERI